MKNRIITISREFGSGGRTIGKALAEKLNIRQGTAAKNRFGKWI